MSKRTQKDIKQEIENLDNQIFQIKKYPSEIIELEKKLYDMKNAHLDEVRPQVNVWKSDIEALKLELRKKKEENQIQLSERVEKWLSKYTSGVSFGYAEPKIVWISEDERFVIITSPGGTAGTGTAMGTGGYYYAASTHWLADTTNPARYIGDGGKGNRWMEHDGRLTKEVKEKMIAYTEELRKNEKL